MTIDKVAAAVGGYARRVEVAAQEAYSFQEPAQRPVVMVQELRKYYRLVQAYDGGLGQRMVHSFVDKRTGDVFKPAGWNAPAKGARYNVIKDAALLHRVVDYTGGYLYKNYTPPEETPKVL